MLGADLYAPGVGAPGEKPWSSSKGEGERQCAPLRTVRIEALHHQSMKPTPPANSPGESGRGAEEESAI